MALLPSPNTSPATPSSPCSRQTSLQAASETHQPQSLCTDHSVCPGHSLTREPMAPKVHSVTPQSGLPDPPLKTAYPPPPCYPRTLLHLSPRVLFSPHLLSLQLSVSLLSVSLEKVKPTRAGLWSVLFTTVFPGLDQCPGQRQGSAGIREMNENCQVGLVPLSFLPHPFPALAGSQGIL